MRTTTLTIEDIRQVAQMLGMPADEIAELTQESVVRLDAEQIDTIMGLSPDNLEAQPVLTQLQYVVSVMEANDVQLEDLPQETPSGTVELREANQAFLEEYFAIEGISTEQRMPFFHEEINYEVMFTESTLVDRSCGHDQVRLRFQKLEPAYGEYRYTNFAYYPNEDPNVFVVEADVDATFAYPMFKEPRPYHNYALFLIFIRDGKIWTIRQFSDPTKLVHDFWKEQPDNNNRQEVLYF